MHESRSRGPGLLDGLSLSGSVAVILVAVLAIGIFARFDLNVPGSPVPQSAQTLAVLLVGAVLGARAGILALLTYLAFGAVGAPLFADGAAGWQHLLGPTSGYLVSFVVAAGVVGWLADRGSLERFGPALTAMLAAHAIILALGWLRLGTAIGFGEAFLQGVQPFIVGGVAKSLLAALGAMLFHRWSQRQQAPQLDDPT